MNIREQIQHEIEVLETRLAQLDRVPSDTYPIGTIALFSAQSGKKWFYRKTAEESWVKINGGEPRSLAEWILRDQQNEGYFEVYRLVTQPQPIYSTS